MNYRIVAWLVAGFGLLGVEIAALIRHDPLLTDAMRLGSNRWLLWPALIGTLGGHFFGQSTLPSWCAWGIVPLGLAVIYRDFFIGSEVAVSMHLVFFLLFTAAGALLWGSR